MAGAPHKISRNHGLELRALSKEFVNIPLSADESPLKPVPPLTTQPDHEVGPELQRVDQLGIEPLRHRPLDLRRHAPRVYRDGHEPLVVVVHYHDVTSLVTEW